MRTFSTGILVNVMREGGIVDLELVRNDGIEDTREPNEYCDENDRLDEDDRLDDAEFANDDEDDDDEEALVEFEIIILFILVIKGWVVFFSLEFISGNVQPCSHGQFFSIRIKNLSKLLPCTGREIFSFETMY